MNQYGKTQFEMNLGAYHRDKKNAVNDTINFILHRDKPKDRRSNVVRAVCVIRTQKT